MTDISRRNFLRASSVLLAAGSAPEWANHLLAAVPPPQVAAAWIRMPRIVNAEGYVSPFYPEMEYDPERAVNIARSIHANAFRYPAASYYANFPTQTQYPKHPQLTGDPMRETFRLCRAANIKNIAYVPVIHPFMAVHDPNPFYPNWQRRDADGNPFVTSHFGFTDLHEGCLNSPLRDVAFAMVKEVLAYDIDLVYFDGPYQGMDQRAKFCHCVWCRALYQKEMGRDIPKEDGPIDEVAVYTNWIDNRCTDTLRGLADLVRHERNLPVLYNDTSLLSRGWCRSRSISATDGFMFEAAETPEEKLFNLQLGQSTGKTIWTYVGFHSQYNREHLADKSIRGWYAYPVDGDDLLMDGSVAFAAGTGMVYWGLSRLYSLPKPTLEYAEGRNIQSIFTLMEKHGPLLEPMQTSPQAGVWISSQTVESYNADKFVLAAYADGFRGIWQVMQSGSFTAEPFLDFALGANQLSRYRVVYLSNAACLSEAQVKMLANYVSDGGFLIATHRSGVADEDGRPLQQKPLHTLLGIELTSETPIEKPDLYLKFPGSDDLIPQDPQIMLFRALPGTEVLASTCDLAHHMTVLGPAITLRSYGKGTAIYIGSSLETIYDETMLPPVRDVLLQLLEPTLGPERRYRIAPTPGLMAHYTASSDKIILHLLADTGDKLKKLRVTEDYLPITDIGVAIRIPQGRRATAASLLRADHAVPFDVKDGWLQLKVDRILIHEAVIVQLA